ncbi:hypothetical protein, partial [Mycobacterium sp.]|uniref:hypothetical protein n=1 Tax=Mycobacterium sp. TaxID=1785 RepID=UPI003CC5DB89
CALSGADQVYLDALRFSDIDICGGRSDFHHLASYSAQHEQIPVTRIQLHHIGMPELLTRMKTGHFHLRAAGLTHQSLCVVDHVSRRRPTPNNGHTGQTST